MPINLAKTWLCNGSLSLSHGEIRDTVTLNWKKMHRFNTKKHDIERNSAGQAEFQTSKINQFFFLPSSSQK